MFPESFAKLDTQHQILPQFATCSFLIPAGKGATGDPTVENRIRPKKEPALLPSFQTNPKLHREAARVTPAQRHDLIGDYGASHVCVPTPHRIESRLRPHHSNSSVQGTACTWADKRTQRRGYQGRKEGETERDGQDEGKPNCISMSWYIHTHVLLQARFVFSHLL